MLDVHRTCCRQKFRLQGVVHAAGAAEVWDAGGHTHARTLHSTKHTHAHDTPHHPDCRRTHSRPHPSRNTHIHAIHHTTGPHARSAGPVSVPAARHRCTHREEGHRLGAREHVRHLLDRCHPRRHLRAGGACDAGGESQGGTRGRCSGSKEPGQQPSRARTASARNGVSVPAPGQALQRVCAGFGRTVSLPVRAQFSVFWEAHAARGTAHAPSTPCRQKAAARCA